MRRSLFVFMISTFIFHSNLKGQGKFYDQDLPSSELCVYTGMSFYIGDLNQTGYFRYQDPAVGAGFRYNFNKRFAIRLNGMVDKIHANDADSPDLVQRQRNLGFRSWVEELSAQIEFNFLPFKVGSDDIFCPYIFLGAGGFHFNPQGTLNGKWYDLQPLSTEGQGTAASPGTVRYPLQSLCLPFGMGFKWSLGKYVGIGIESGMRKTYTDYLDDVSTVYPDPSKLGNPLSVAFSNRSLNQIKGFSYAGRQRGNSTTTDWYNFTGVVISIKLPKKEPKCTGVQK